MKTNKEFFQNIFKEIVVLVVRIHRSVMFMELNRKNFLCVVYTSLRCEDSRIGLKKSDIIARLERTQQNAG